MKANQWWMVPVVAFMSAAGAAAQNIWINEIHYDNAGPDANEIVEVVLENPGNYNLADFSVILYNGNNGASYDTRTLDAFTQGGVVGSFGIFWFDYDAAGGSIQNGSPDGMAVAYQGTLVPGQFLSYEGTFQATDGPASGMMSADIGVSESSSTPAGSSLQLSGYGTVYPDFAWQNPAPATPGTANNGQTFGGGVLPEPGSYPADFKAQANLFTLTLSWTDAAGGQLPKKYLVKASNANDIISPVDGIPEPDDPDLSDGTGARNVPLGIQTCSFTSLESGTTFYFKIFPYTNSGSDINYKTDSVPPSAQATVCNYAAILFKDFEDHAFDPWDTVRLSGNQEWTIDSTGNDHYARIDGYSSPEPCNDWLISPALNFNPYGNETLSFATSKIYPGPDLEVVMSEDYVTGNDPSTGTWNGLTAVLSPGNGTWTPSGNIDVSEFSGTNVHLAFRYTSDAGAAVWEIDDIVLYGGPATATDPGKGRGGVTLQPNPARDRVTVITGRMGGKDIRILNLVGQPVREVTTCRAEETIDVSGLAPGIYFVSVKETGSSPPAVLKLVIR